MLPSLLALAFFGGMSPQSLQAPHSPPTTITSRPPHAPAQPLGLEELDLLGPAQVGRSSRAAGREDTMHLGPGGLRGQEEAGDKEQPRQASRGRPWHPDDF